MSDLLYNVGLCMAIGGLILGINGLLLVIFSAII